MTGTRNNEDFCGSLPLNLINHIQDYGVLLVLDHEARIIQASANISVIIGGDVAAALQKPIAELITEGSMERIKGFLSSGKKSRRISSLSFISNGNTYPVIIHTDAQFHIIEIELAAAGNQSFISVFEQVKGAMANIQECSTVQETCDVAVRELKRFSGFDRLLIYRFDEAWNGTVIAQVREDFMADYMGLRFPASDIPRQARALYQTNPYRLIPNRDYTPIRLHPVINPITSSFTDLSPCNLRSVAGVHLEYMRNMDTMASMSTRILIDGRLWGLISCHSRAARQLTYEQSAVFELVSDVVAARIATLEMNESSALKSGLKSQLARFVERLYLGNDLQEAIRHTDLLQLFRACGLVYTHGYRIESYGDIPGETALRDLLFWLCTRHSDTIFSTRALANEFDEWRAYDGAICGMLSIPVRAEQQEYLILFRGEVLEEVSWGGNPNDALQMEPDGKSYHPRNSFSIWKESVSGHCTPWSNEEIELAGDIRQVITEYLLSKA